MDTVKVVWEVPMGNLRSLVMDNLSLVILVAMDRQQPISTLLLHNLEEQLMALMHNTEEKVCLKQTMDKHNTVQPLMEQMRHNITKDRYMNKLVSLMPLDSLLLKTHMVQLLRQLNLEEPTEGLSSNMHSSRSLMHRHKFYLM
ncbi:Hypothetical protein FKW44_022123 [Caligus rogercresseyi]|uniref:Uncharacterized protein n=1 Tax=Caligus rogercresseyi TaxID=217165 RepID=A0A7T8GSB6_CALRO|nr:Hypothetical protein FKW44_022123 [Caligus rogercresseyi]